ncbi:MAG TPA: hypothetical protein DF613_06500 [Lachnospiraceae bacterium]|nr:hypothetical protein [Lachnospiraceae bacterium]
MKIYQMEEKYRQYTGDESRLTGRCDSISFPETEDEAAEILAHMAASKIPVTLQGGLTGVTGGAVPWGGHVMNLSRMTKILDYQKTETGALLTVEPGLTVLDLKKEIRRLAGKDRLFWPAWPTAETASVGGIAANNSRGICSYHYGDARANIASVRFLAADGRRKTVSAREEPGLFGRIVGGEGAGGVITALELTLIPRPESLWAICFFLKTEETAARFVEGARSIAGAHREDTAFVAALEYLDGPVLALIGAGRDSVAKLQDLPEFPSNPAGAVYMELHGSEDGVEELAGELLELSADCGCMDEDTWAVSGEAEARRLEHFRGAASELVNARIDEIKRTFPAMTKLAADMDFPTESFADTLARYRKGAERINVPCYIYGHAGTGSPYANLMPENAGEYEACKELLRDWARECRTLGGMTAGEYGVGKLAESLLGELVPEEKQETFHALTAEWDPAGILRKKLWKTDAARYIIYRA